ncbi:MAG TPA: hypothetical protein VME70_07445, partial [Mycobacteriales bacterium]|nr:hypothetical protein [Mycobacteriales bacterium]
TPSASSSPSPSSVPGPVATGSAGIAAATAQLKHNWALFFNSNTPPATAQRLLQDGPSLGAAVRFAESIAKKAKSDESAVVKKITFTPDGTQATVIYNLLINKTPFLKKASGHALLLDGKWKVSKISFCTLVDLGAGNKKVPGCS